MIDYNFFIELEKKNINYKKQYLMSNLSSFKIGGKADAVIFIKSIDEIIYIFKLIKVYNISYTIIGNCSNSLILDKGIRGVVIVLNNEFSEINVLKDDIVKCNSGLKLLDLIKFANDNFFYGVQNLVGIPATVGGAIYMNAGAFDFEISDYLIKVDVYDIEKDKILELTKEELEFGYRKSLFQNKEFVILNAYFKFQKREKDELIKITNDIMEKRASKQPLEYPSAGSIFKRPVGYYAGTLIQESGLKGYRIGGAEVSKKHSGFIVNVDNAKAKDVLDLILYIKKEVFNKFNVLLHRELKIIGEYDDNVLEFFKYEQELEKCQDIEIKIISGLSGAGKSTVIRRFEDMGYYCIDNLLPDLLDELIKICKKNSEITKIAICIDVRSKSFFEKSKIKILDFIKNEKNAKLIFLEASDNILVERFKETRRVHPLNPKGSIIKGIKIEREKMSLLREQANYIIDTSKFTTRQLSKHINDMFANSNDNINVIFQSFGFKNGLPLDSDLVFDVRFLPNPYYIPEMRELNGNDEEVYNYVINQLECKEFLEKLVNLLTFLIPNYIKEDKKQVVISIGCTGGQHRSVSITNKLYEYFKNMNYNIMVVHRELENKINI